MLIGNFFREDVKYSLHFSNGEFSLLMRPSIDSIQKNMICMPRFTLMTKQQAMSMKSKIHLWLSINLSK